MSQFLNGALRRLTPYTPGEQPRNQAYIKLNTNESPYPPSPGVLAALNRAEGENLRLYSDPEAVELREALAARYGVERENVFVANGSDEALSFAFLAYAADGRGVAFPDISYGFYAVFARLYGIPVRQVPLRADFRLVPEDYNHLHRTIVLANPNAPTGLALSRDEVGGIVRANPDAVVVAVGCYVQAGKEEALLDGSIDLAVGNNRKKDIVEILEAFLAKREKAGGRESGGDVWEEKTLSRRSVVDISREEAYEEMTLLRPQDEEGIGGEAGSNVGRGPEDGDPAGVGGGTFGVGGETALSAHTRAYIKIQDGCNQFCSYCIIPYARGRVRSRRQEDVLREIRGLAESGVKEVVLTGIHLSSYGMDFIDKTDGDYLENGKDLRGTAMERAYLLNLILQLLTGLKESGWDHWSRGLLRRSLPAAWLRFPRCALIFIFPCKAAVMKP